MFSLVKSKGLNRMIKNVIEKKTALFSNIKPKFYCNLCGGKGYLTCSSCSNGCNSCSGLKQILCFECSGIGIKGYTYF